MLNKNWGIYKTFTLGTTSQPYLSSISKYEGIVPSGDPNAGKPMFSFPYLDPTNQIPLQTTFKDDTGILSRWQGQFGIRYMFN